MFNGKIIDELLKRKGATKRDLVNAVGWKAHSQYHQFTEGNPTASTLEKVADFFGCSIDLFFLREQDAGEPFIFVGDRASLEERLISLQSLVDSKNRHIEDLEKMLQIFEKIYKTGK